MRKSYIISLYIDYLPFDGVLGASKFGSCGFYTFFVALKQWMPWNSKAKVIQKSHVELSLVELSCRKKQQKKVLTKKLLILGNRVLNKHMGHLGPIWYHSEPMFTIHQTSFLVGTFFAASYNKMALVTYFDTKKIGIFLKAKTLT